MYSGRPLIVASVSTAATALLGWLLAPAVAPAAPGFETTLVSACAATGLAATAWLWLLTQLVVVDVLRGRPARRGVPPVVRRAVLAACGLSLAGALGSAAHADPGNAVPQGPAATTGALTGLPLPDRTTGAAAASRPGPEPAARTAPRTTATTVSAGDTLWGLAAGTLPAHAPDAAVATRWQEIHDANRAVVGPDPDLIHPGQRLRLPGPTDTTPRSRS